MTTGRINQVSYEYKQLFVLAYRNRLKKRLYNTQTQLGAVAGRWATIPFQMHICPWQLSPGLAKDILRAHPPTNSHLRLMTWSAAVRSDARCLKWTYAASRLPGESNLTSDILAGESTRTLLLADIQRLSDSVLSQDLLLTSHGTPPLSSGYTARSRTSCLYWRSFAQTIRFACVRVLSFSHRVTATNTSSRRASMADAWNSVHCGTPPWASALDMCCLLDCFLMMMSFRDRRGGDTDTCF